MRQLKIKQQITLRNKESISRYFQEINKHPLISVNEEVELSVLIKDGDNKASEKLIIANLRFVISVAKQYQNRGLSLCDLINEGNLGLVKAVEKYDETKGFKFISYAVWWIRQSIIQAILEQSRVVRLPVNRISAMNKITSVISYLEQEYEREPSSEEIANYLDLKNEDVYIAKMNQKKELSFDVPLSNSNENEANLYDFIKCDNTTSPDDNLMNESLCINIQRALKKLSKREKDVITMTFGLSNTQTYTQQDIALKYKMSSERIRQIRSKALHKLRNIMQENKAFF